MIPRKIASPPDPRAFQVVAMTGLLPQEGDVEISNLDNRLADGYRRIEAAIARGEDVQIWEDFWVSLLHSYERLCDDLEQAA